MQKKKKNKGIRVNRRIGNEIRIKIKTGIYTGICITVEKTFFKTGVCDTVKKKKHKRISIQTEKTLVKLKNKKR